MYEVFFVDAVNNDEMLLDSLKMIESFCNQHKVLPPYLTFLFILNSFHKSFHTQLNAELVFTQQIQTHCLLVH